MIETYRNFLNWDYEIRYKLAPLIVVIILLIAIHWIYTKIKMKRKVIKWEKDLEIRKNVLQKAKEEKTDRFSDYKNNNMEEKE